MSNRTMKNVARILLALVAVFLLVNGLMLMFNPTGAIAGLAVSAGSAEGLSNIRALWGGSITAIGISVLIAAVTCEIKSARPAVLFTFALVVARLTGITVDGMYDKALLFTLVPVAVFLMLLLAHKLLDYADEGRSPGD